MQTRQEQRPDTDTKEEEMEDEEEEDEEGDEIFFPPPRKPFPKKTPKSYYRSTPQVRTIRGRGRGKRLFSQKGSGSKLGLLFKNDKYWDNV